MASSAPQGSLDVALAHATRLAQADPDLALAQVAEILLAAPGHPQALLIAARAHRFAGRAGEAKRQLSSLATAQPRSAATAFELALACRALGESAAAMTALRRAVALDPAHAEAWQTLAEELRLDGDEAASDAAHLAGIRASAKDPELIAAGLALAEDRLEQAEPMLRARLKQRPTDVPAIRMLAELAGRLGRNRDAETLLRRALELAPGFAPARFNLATALHRQSRSTEAIAEVDTLLAEQPHHPSYSNLKAAALSRLGDYAPAIALYDRVLADYPNQPKVWMSLGHALKTVGRQDDSIAAYRRSIAMTPTLGEAWWSLANLKTYRFDEADTAAMRRALDAPDLGDEDRFHLDFALGKASEDDRDFAGAFDHYVEGNRRRRSLIDYDPADVSAGVERQRALFTAEFFADRAGWGCAAPDPIFVVSLPRSGSTLIEQILASHSRVEGTTELPDIAAIAARVGGEAIRDLDRDAVRALGEEYLDRTRVQRKTDAPRFVDKMPNNWLHAGLIRLILPNATIVDARRHPIGCCLSNFKQHFARGQTFTYDLGEIGRYYRDYVRLMAHFDAAMPGHVHRVFYERMVEDTEAEVRALLAHARLPFEDACLRFHETDRAVRTASSEQVRRPIFREGMEQWRSFEPWLDPLRQALGAVVDAYPEVPAGL